METQKEVTFFHSISWKITLLVIVVVAISVAGNLISGSSYAQDALEEVNENYILSMAELAQEFVEYEYATQGEEADYSEVLSDISMTGISSSYAYLVAQDGTMLYHPTAEKIGQAVENSVVLGIVDELKAGRTPEAEVVLYEYKGEWKYAAYAITEQKQIIVVTADQAEVIAPVNKMVRAMGILSVIILIICVVAGYLVAHFICKPIKMLTVIIYNTYKLDFRHNPWSDKLCVRKDESGEMARNIRMMRRTLKQMLQEINEASEMITEGVSGLNQITQTVDTMCTDNSATSQELAAGMQETAATTVNVNENIGLIRKGAQDIVERTEEGNQTSQEVMKRAEQLREKTVAASTKTMDMYSTVKVRAEEAIEGSKAVEQINELTDSIMEISSQTGLLALNASIEAARAGEAGRGFSVVATEISKLADQTSQAIANISDIVKAVNLAVGKMSECLEDTTDFLEHTVLKDYKEFEQVSDQYQGDADIFGASMNEVSKSMEQLGKSIESIAQAVSGINDTVGESAVGVTDIAQKTSEMVEKTSAAQDMVSGCYQSVDKLKNIVARFVLE